MNKYRHLREKANALRKKGKSLGEISKMLSLGKGTVYYWIRGTSIPRTETHSRTAAQSLAQKRGAKANKEKWAARRKVEYDRGLLEAPVLLQSYDVRDFVSLYIGEGTRNGRWEVGVANSNMAVIKMAARMIRRFSLKPPQLVLQVHADHDENKVLHHWSKSLGISPREIRMAQKSNQSFLKTRNWRSVYGTAHVRVCDTLLRARMQGWIDYLLSQWNGV